MYIAERQALLKTLRQLHQPLSLVLQIKVGQLNEHSFPAVDQFSSRLEYRQALISRQSTIAASEVRAAEKRFRKIGLKTRVGTLTKTVVVEATVDLLEKALADESVESAAIDEELSLIRPVKDN